jgi:hypothetical protein
MCNSASSTIWYSLLSETQYATELTLVGLRTLSQVPLPQDLPFDNGDTLRYRLHVGMHAYTSGLERLGKLAISCQCYLDNGSFPNVRDYSHSLNRIFSKLDSLTFPSNKSLAADYLDGPMSAFDSSVLRMLEEFAKGTARYEYLDSLSTDQPESDTYVEWTRLCAKAKRSRLVEKLIDMHDAIPNALYASVPGDLEGLLCGLVDNRPGPFMKGSVVLVRTLFEMVRGVAARLSAASNEAFYGRPTGNIPMLEEVVGPALIHPWEAFFEFHIAQLGDSECVAEALSRRREA